MADRKSEYYASEIIEGLEVRVIYGDNNMEQWREEQDALLPPPFSIRISATYLQYSHNTSVLLRAEWMTPLRQSYKS